MKPGATVTATAAAEIEPGWHVYALTQGPGGPHALEVAVQKSPAFTVAGKITGKLVIADRFLFTGLARDVARGHGGMDLVAGEVGELHEQAGCEAHHRAQAHH